MIEKEVEFPKWKNYFERSVESVLSAKLSSSTAFGKVLAYNGQVIEVSSLPGVLGSLCTISPENSETIKGEIVSVTEERVDILPYESNLDVRVGDTVFLTETQQEVRVGNGLLGRVVDGLGAPLDGMGPLELLERKGLNGARINPFKRKPITKVSIRLMYLLI